MHVMRLQSDFKTPWILCSASHEYLSDKNQLKCMLENLFLKTELHFDVNMVTNILE